MPATVEEFSTQVGGIVDLEIGPDGDLYYLDILAGAVHHISYGGTGNQPPVARAYRRPPRGCGRRSPVAFNGSTSTDPEHGALTYAWDLDGDGVFDDSTACESVAHLHDRGRGRMSRLRVRDPHGLTNDAAPSRSRPATRLPGTDDHCTYREHDVADRPNDQLPGHGHRRRRRDPAGHRARLEHRLVPLPGRCHVPPAPRRAASTTRRVAASSLPDHEYPRVHRDHPHRDGQHRRRRRR